jgi:hypothetical protein
MKQICNKMIQFRAAPAPSRVSARPTWGGALAGVRTSVRFLLDRRPCSGAPPVGASRGVRPPASTAAPPRALNHTRALLWRTIKGRPMGNSDERRSHRRRTEARWLCAITAAVVLGRISLLLPSLKAHWVARCRRTETEMRTAPQVSHERHCLDCLRNCFT